MIQYIFTVFFYLVIVYFVFSGVIAIYSLICPVHQINKKYWGYIFAGFISLIIGIIAYMNNNYYLLLIGFFFLFLIRKVFGGEPDLDPNKITKDNKRNLKEYIYSGIDLAEAHNFEEALFVFNKALEIDPKNILALNNKANTLNNLYKYEEAISICDKALEISPNSVWSLCHKAVALTNLGNYHEALRCYDKAIMIEPKNFQAKNNKRRCLYRCYEILFILEKMPKYTLKEISEINADFLWSEVNEILSKNQRINFQ